MTNVTPPSSDVPPAGNVTPPPATPYQTAPAGTPVKQALSLTSFILGVGSLVVLSWIPFLGLLASAVAVVLAFMAKSKEPQAPSWMWIVGMIAGFIGVAIGLVYAIVIIIGIAVVASSPELLQQY